MLSDKLNAKIDAEVASLVLFDGFDRDTAERIAVSKIAAEMRLKPADIRRPPTTNNSDSRVKADAAFVVSRLLSPLAPLVDWWSSPKPGRFRPRPDTIAAPLDVAPSSCPVEPARRVSQARRAPPEPTPPAPPPAQSWPLLYTGGGLRRGVNINDQFCGDARFQDDTATATWCRDQTREWR
jgi:hypothetical protein